MICMKRNSWYLKTLYLYLYLPEKVTSLINKLMSQRTPNVTNWLNEFFYMFEV